jgi:hypothetical protein
MPKIIENDFAAGENEIIELGKDEGRHTGAAKRIKGECTKNNTPLKNQETRNVEQKNHDAA